MSVPSENPSAAPSTVGSPTFTPIATPIQPASPARRPGGIMSFTRSSLNFFGANSRGAERNSLVDMVTQEGSIKKEAWTLMSSGNTNKTRVRTLMNLQEVMKSRNLQVSTLEGIWHETKDMLGDPDTKEPTLRAIIELTTTQHQQLGLALRHTFFEKIRDVGCEELTIKWLNALSENCRNVNGFEKAMDFLIADWIQSVLTKDDHPAAYKVVQMAEQLIMHNSAFICESSMISLVRSACGRCAKLGDPLTSPCLDLLTSVQKYSELPRSELPLIVATLSCLVVIPLLGEQAWAVARNLLNSQLGHRTRNILAELLKNAQSSLQLSGTDRARVIRSVRGAVYFLVQSTWGTRKIESVRASPVFVTDALESAVTADPTVCMDVLLGVKRLVMRFGRDLQHITWQRIVRMFHVVHELIQLEDSYSICRPTLAQLLDQLEQLHLHSQFAGSNDELFELLESCLDCRCDDSIALIIDYRSRELSQLQPDWLQQAKALVEKYGGKSFSMAVRKKAMSSMQSLYHQCKSVSEHEIVTMLLLPMLGQLIPVEEECEVQYQMLLTLVDITKSVTVRPGESALFDQVLDVIRRMFVDGLFKCFETTPTVTESATNYNSVHTDNRHFGGFCLENQEIVVRELDEMLVEKWQVLPPNTFKNIIDMLVQNAAKQYSLGQYNEAGSDVRAAIFNVLFTVRACPITKRMMREREDDGTQVHNVFVKLFDGKDGDFSWAEIAEIAVTALSTDRSWPVTLSIISGLGKVLEYTEMVRTAGVKLMESLVEALLNVTVRASQGDYFYRDREEKSKNEASGDRLRLLPLVLSALIGYTVELKWENRSHELCRQIVEYAKLGSTEAIIASSIAVQRVPDSFASFSRLFVELLSQQEPVHSRAIPVLEFFADAAHIEQFHNFFQEEHFKQVTDCVAPYTLVEYYHPFIVTIAHRVLMMWFSLVPEKMRLEMRRVMMERVQQASSFYYPKGVSRQPSGDGRNESSMYALGGPPDTPPPIVGLRRVNPADEISEEIERALAAFFWLGKIDDVMEDTSPDRMVEQAFEHFLVNDHILTVRTLTEREEDDVFSPQQPCSSHSTSSPSPAATAALTKGDSPLTTVGTGDGSTTPRTFADQRRRYQSAVQAATNKQLEERRALDDMDADRRDRSSVTSRSSTLPQVTYTQLIVRSMYGRRSWLMRSLELVHVEYEMMRRVSEDATSLMQHVAGLPTACMVGKKNDEQVNARLRNLDRTPGLELFPVGVLYKGVGQKTEDEFLKNVYGSERYSRFIRQLGNVRSLTSCPAGLERGKHGKYTYEYKDAISRVVFLIATLMPTTAKDPQCNEKKKLIGNNVVMVLFNESGDVCRLQQDEAGRKSMKKRSFVQATIEITPVDNYNCMVYVSAQAEVLCWLGMRKVVLPDMLAARVVRQLVIRSKLAVEVHRSMQATPEQPRLSMAIERLRMIRALKDKCQPVAPLVMA